jgi:hypothetical protein
VRTEPVALVEGPVLVRPVRVVDVGLPVDGDLVPRRRRRQRRKARRHSQQQRRSHPNPPPHHAHSFLCSSSLPPQASNRNGYLALAGRAT